MRAELIGTFCFLFSNRWHLLPSSMEEKFKAIVAAAILLLESLQLLLPSILETWNAVRYMLRSTGTPSLPRRRFFKPNLNRSRWWPHQVLHFHLLSLQRPMPEKFRIAKLRLLRYPSPRVQKYKGLTSNGMTVQTGLNDKATVVIENLYYVNPLFGRDMLLVSTGKHWGKATLKISTTRPKWRSCYLHQF